MVLSVVDNRAGKNLLRVKVPQWRVWYKWYTYRVLPDKISRYFTVITHRFNGRERVGVIVRNLNVSLSQPPSKMWLRTKRSHLLINISLVAEWKFLKKLFRKYSLWSIHVGVIIVGGFFVVVFLFVWNFIIYWQEVHVLKDLRL